MISEKNHERGNKKEKRNTGSKKGKRQEDNST
jgi:hypothetical protein